MAYKKTKKNMSKNKKRAYYASKNSNRKKRKATKAGKQRASYSKKVRRKMRGK